jgi:two-component system response regulator NreC
VPERGGPAHLTARELDVLRLIALGNTNQEIAWQLGLSVRTIESQRCHIQAKTEPTTRAALVGYALDAGLLDEDRRRPPASRTAVPDP